MDQENIGTATDLNPQVPVVAAIPVDRHLGKSACKKQLFKVGTALDLESVLIAGAFLLGMLAAFPHAATAQDQGLATKKPSLIRLEQVVECFNQTDPSRRKKFLTEAFQDQSETALEERANFVAETRERLAGLKIDEVLRAEEHRIMANCKSENGSVVEIYLELTNESPYLIKNIDLEPVKTVVSKGKFEDIQMLPRNEMGNTIGEFLAVVNAGDSTAITEFLTEKTTLQRETWLAVEEFPTAAKSAGGFAFYAVRQYAVTEPNAPVVVIVRGKTANSWHAFVFQLSPQDQITAIKLAAARAPKGSAPKPTITRADAINEVLHYLDQLKDSGEFSGTILVAADDEILVHRAMGLASRRFDVPNNVETKFNLGSMNKMFTGIAVSQLIEEGKLSYDDTVDDFLSPDWLSHDVAAKITIRHLLTHTSGLGEYFNQEFWESPKQRLRELDDYRILFRQDALNLEPGLRWKYSNSGMFLLGVVIEKVSGQSYFDYVRTHIYEPAGMHHTDCYAMDEPIPNLATGYYLRGEKVVNNQYSIFRGGPAGGGYSTTEDLFKFSRARTQNRLLNEDATEAATSAKPEFKSPNYGYGFQVRDEENMKVFGHSGGDDGVSTRLDILPESGFAIIVLANLGDPAERVAKELRRIIGRAKSF